MNLGCLRSESVARGWSLRCPRRCAWCSRRSAIGSRRGGCRGTAALSPQAQLGRQIFFDPTLSASGKLSCASCHDPTNAYAAPKASGVVMRGGANMDRPGLRAVPSLRYLSDTPRFSRHTYFDVGRDREDVGPAGGFMLDGRADNLREQMLLPLLDPAEMANSSVAEVAARLRRTPYASAASPGGWRILAVSRRAVPRRDSSPRRTRGTTGTQPLVDAAAAALERFELEDPSFHPYNSRFDRVPSRRPATLRRRGGRTAALRRPRQRQLRRLPHRDHGSRRARTNLHGLQLPRARSATQSGDTGEHRTRDSSTSAYAARDARTSATRVSIAAISRPRHYAMSRDGSSSFTTADS